MLLLKLIFAFSFILGFLKAQEPFMMFSKNMVDFQNQPFKKFLPEEKNKYYQFSNLRPTYNFFIGEDAQWMSTTFKGFGSISEWNLVLGYPFTIGKNKVKFLILPRTGVLWKKFRFSKNLVPSLDTTMEKTVFSINNDPTKDFGRGFFSYGKTKLIVPTYRFNPEFGISIDVGDQAIGITTGPVLDLTLNAKFKQKYRQDGQKKKEVVRGNEKLNVNPFQYGISAAIMTPWIEIFGVYMLSPFFKENKGPSVSQIELGLSFLFIK